MNNKKFNIIFFSVNFLMVSLTGYLLWANFSLSKEISGQENNLVKSGKTLDSLHSVKLEISAMTESNNTEIERLRKLKENSFPEFAKRFITSLNSSAGYLDNTEQNIIVSNIDGDKMYLNYVACNNLEYYKNKRTRIGKNEIYFYDIVYEFSDKGSEHGVTLLFRKDSNGNFKLYKMNFDGC